MMRFLSCKVVTTVKVPCPENYARFAQPKQRNEHKVQTILLDSQVAVCLYIIRLVTFDTKRVIMRKKSPVMHTAKFFHAIVETCDKSKKEWKRNYPENVFENMV